MSASQKPNIVYIHSHDTGRYVSPYGYAIPTPNIQKLAEQGVLFRQNFCAGPTCSPSRAALLTGQYPHCSGMLGLAHRGFALHDYKQHLIHTLAQAGYNSSLAGIQHVAKDAETIGYDRIIPTESCQARHVAPAAVDFLNKQKSEPFFLSVGFFETHRQFPPTRSSQDAKYCRPPAPMPDSPETRQDMAQFIASARQFDTGVGMVLDAIDANRLAENTIIICTTDHGIAFPAMKCNLTHHGTGVMLIIRGPHGLTGGKVSDALISHIDIFPTLCDILDIESPPWLQGKSIMPTVKGTAEEIHEQIFAEITYHAAYDPQRSVRTHKLSYMRCFDDQRHTIIRPNCDDGPSKDLWLKNNWSDRPRAAEQLYDLIFDPNETCNVADRPEYAQAINDMRARLHKHLKNTQDPILNHPIHVPGAIVNDANGQSPNEPTSTLVLRTA